MSGGFAGVLLFMLALFSAAATVNAIHPFRQSLLLLPSMLWSWFVIGLLGHHILVQAIVASFLISQGALDSVLGRIAGPILLLSWIGTAVILVISRRSGPAVRETLSEAGIPLTPHRVPRFRVLMAFPFRGRSVEKIKGIEFRRAGGHTIELDVYRDRSGSRDRPVLVYIHGGAWIIGDKREQGLPLIHHMARNGWLCVSVNYRLSPVAGWPDHLVDVKAGIAWVREHAAEFGGDPAFLAVSGGSAGGHLAALVGLTANLPEYQPGFEGVDTTVDVAAPIYGIYDVTNRLGVQSRHFVPRLMEPIVMKAYLKDEPEKFREASPIDRVHSGAPPFIVVQGDRDTMAPVEEARAFVTRLRDESSERVVYTEFPGAQHIFDLGYSYQSARMIEGVLSVLEDEVGRAGALDSG